MVITLAGGSRLGVRRIRPGDKQELQAGLGRLSEKSRYSRFLTPKERFSTAELRYLTEVDGVDHYALVASPLEDPDRIVAVARWVRLADRPDTAEAAITVADCMQRNGVGRELSRLLADAAARRGVRRFTATMLGSNVAAAKLLDAMHLRLERQTSAGVTEVSWELAA